MAKGTQKSIDSWVIKKSKQKEADISTGCTHNPLKQIQSDVTCPDCAKSGPIDHIKGHDAKEANANTDLQLNEVVTNGKIPAPKKVSTRIFNFCQEWLIKFPWIELNGSQYVTCKICKDAKEKSLFLKSTTTNERFISEGFNNWKKGLEKFGAHEKSKQHLQALTTIAANKSTSVSVLHGNKIHVMQQESQIALKAMFTSMIYVAGQGLALRGHEADTGNYIELLNLRAADIPELQSFLQRKKPYTTPEIQNEMLQGISHSILRKKISEISQNRIFSLIVDETTDVSGREQISVCFRTVTDDLDVKEEFLGLYETDSTKSDSILKCIKDVLKRFNLNMKDLRGQCFDGAANMSGVYNGVAAQIAREEPRCVYIHCYAHCLNLVIQDVVKSDNLLRDCLSYVNGIGVVLKGSAKRLSLYEEITREFEDEDEADCEQGKAKETKAHVKPQPLCATRWTVRGKNVSSVISNYALILKFLEELASSKDRVASTAAGLHKQLSRVETHFGLLVLQQILSPTESLSRVIQSKQATVSGIIKSAHVTMDSLQKSKLRFQNIWENALNAGDSFSLEPPKQKRNRKVPKRYEVDDPKQDENVEAKYKKIFNNAIDMVIAEMKARFDQPGIKKMEQLEDILLHWKQLDSNAKREKLENVCKTYGFDYERIANNMETVYGISTIDCSNVSEFVKSYEALVPEVRALFPEFRKFLKLLLVVPISSATAERSFSVLRRIKDYLRSTMGQTRLNYCCVIHCYKEIAKLLSVEELMRNFVNSDYRKSVFGNI